MASAIDSGSRVVRGYGTQGFADNNEAPVNHWMERDSVIISLHPTSPSVAFN